MQQMEIQNMQRQMQGLLYSYSESPDINDSGLSSDLRVRSMPSLFSPMMPRPSPQIDGFAFNPVLSPREQGQRSSERLLRSAAGEDSVFESERPPQRSESAGERYKYSRMSKSDSYAKRKKTSIPGVNSFGQRVSSTSVQARADSADRASQTRDTAPVPPLQFEQLLARKKK